MILRLADVSADDPRVGGKVRGLARARAAGLAVPDGLVLTEPDDDAGAAAAALGEPLVVRSSAAVEDDADRAAAGVLASRRDVRVDDLAAAVRAVRDSAGGETARLYARLHAMATPFPLAVLVQRQVPGVRGTAYSRAFDDGDVLIEAGDEHVALVSRAPPPTLRGRVPGVPDDALVDIARAALAAEDALGRPADIEWVFGDRLWIVQLRPIVAAPRPALPAAFAADLARLDPGVTWTWDAVHNPEPLSPAQQGLVALVDGPLRQAVVGAYLYTAPGGAPEEPVDPSHIPDVLARLEELLAAMSDDLEATLRAYVDFYRLYTIALAPSLARLPPQPGALRRGHPDLAPAWDVAVPTFAETPGLWERLPAPASGSPLRELDDVYFARAQAGVRRALRARARTLGIAEEDVFWLPLDDVRRGVAGDAAPARAQAAALRAFVPPRTIVHGTPVFAPPPAADVLRGRGTGGRARGTVARIDANRPAPVPPRRVLVTATLTPPQALLSRDAAAIVAEHGGLLGHAAALARELGIPCVVGCRGADRLEDGDEVWVDADAGLVLLTSRGGAAR